MPEEVPARGNILGKCLPARYILAILGSLGMAIVYGLKVNLSVAMVAMLNHTALAHTAAKTLADSNVTAPAHTSACVSADGTSDSGPAPEDGPFVWSEPLQGTLLSCYFWGYFVSQIPGAQIAEKFSAKWVMFFSVAINVICTLLTPVMTKMHYVGLIILRVLEGIGGGATFPAMHCMIAAWAPPNERSVMSSIIYVGTAFGTAKSILSAGILASKFGWESVFYVMGGASCVWMVLWMFLIQDSPNKQSLISYEERLMINTQLGTQTKTEGVKEEHPAVPWKKVFTSAPFWAILIAHLCSNFGWYMFLIEIPFYMKQVLKFNVSKNAVASALPYYPMFLLSVILGKTLDTFKAKGILSTTTCRKTATGFSTLIPGACLIGLCFVECQKDLAVGIMTVGIVGMGGMFSGFLSNHIDIAPNYAGTLVALTNTAATLPGIIVPLFVGYITKGNQTISAWRVIYGVTIVLFAVEFIVFTIFGSGEEQSWNKPENKSDEENRKQDESTPLKHQ